MAVIDSVSSKTPEVLGSLDIFADILMHVRELEKDPEQQRVLFDSITRTRQILGGVATDAQVDGDVLFALNTPGLDTVIAFGMTPVEVAKRYRELQIVDTATEATR